MRKIIYLAGPMSGIGGFNRMAFESAQGLAESLGYVAVNPHVIDDTTGVSERLQNCSIPPGDRRSWIERFINVNTEVLKNCDSICLLPGFVGSKGAIHEVAIANRLGLEVFEILDGMMIETCYAAIFKKISDAMFDESVRARFQNYLDSGA